MQEVIRFLEELAVSGWTDDLDAKLLGFHPEARAAIRACDIQGLGAHLGGRAVMACMVFTPDREEEPAPGEDQPDSPPEQPDGESIAA
ncbi:hypothetical protein [Lysobacter claricitrinus]|uniref:hypothetical protein n=1 Tax=Lysobacter claricitrinus TaxID=3367728 RepID=UPI0037DBEB1F